MKLQANDITDVIFLQGSDIMTIIVCSLVLASSESGPLSSSYKPWMIITEVGWASRFLLLVLVVFVVIAIIIPFVLIILIICLFFFFQALSLSLDCVLV